MNGETPSVELCGVTKRFGELVAVDDLSLELGSRRVLHAAGPERLRQDDDAADDRRLRAPDEGEIRIEGEDVAGLPPHRRPTNTVFQSYALFPHLSVEANVAFGLKRKKVPKGEIAERVGAELERVGLARRGRSAARRSSPAACSSGSRWPGRWSTCRRSCSSTSRSAPST